MAKTQLQHFINGEYVASKGNDFFDLVSPVTGEVYAQSPNATEAEVDAAYAAAKKHLKFGDVVHLRLVKKHYLTWQMPLKQMLTV